MRRSLQVRVPVLAMGILAASLAVATLIAYELLLVAGRADLDARLRAERSRFDQAVERIATEVARERGEPVLGTRTLRRAVEKYLSLNPNNPAFMTIVRMDGEILSSRGGPPEVVALRDRGELPTSAPGVLETVRTPVGEIRSLSAQVSVEGEPVALFQVAGPLEPIEEESLRALRRLGVAAIISLPLGGVLLAVVLRRALAPLRDLASTARAVQLQDLSARVGEPEGQDEVAVLANEFNRMLERLQQAARHRQEFLAAVSHELRTPITIARGHIETLTPAAREGPEAVSEAAAVVHRELLRMGRLVEDLMALARSEAEDFVRLRETGLQDLFEELKLRLTGLGMEDVAVHEAPPTTITADADRLAQALLNLVVNARMHNPPGTRIEVGCLHEDDHVCLFVRDDGRGFDPSIVERAFEPFTRGRETGSQGLGLAVVRAVVRAHQGRVDLGTGAHGTTVTIAIPTGLRPSEAGLPRSAGDAGAGDPPPVLVP